MKTFEEVVNRLFKSNHTPELSRTYSKGKMVTFVDFWLGDGVVIWNTDRTDKDEWRSRCNSTLYWKYEYSKTILKPYWGRDIGEPVVKICKRILEKPFRFCSLKNQEQVVERRLEYLSSFNTVLEEVVPEIKVLLDKDTQIKFVLKSGYIENLSYLTKDEQHLLGDCIREWHDSNRELLKHKKQIAEQKRKDKYRQEMIDQYKDL